MSKEEKWNKYCEEQGIDELMPLIGAELIIQENDTFSVLKLMSRLKYSLKNQEYLGIAYPKKKALQKHIVLQLYKMQKLGLIEIVSKIDSTRFQVNFIWRQA